jgi:cell division protein FtsB
MTEEQHSREREQDEGRWRWAFGILVSILLVLAVQAAVALIWGGRISAHVEAAQTDIADTRRALDEALSRVGALEASRAATASDVTGLRRDLTEFRAETREELRGIRDVLQQIYRNGNGTP